MIDISHKKDIKEVCRFIGTKAICGKSTMASLLTSLENQKQFLQIQ